MNHSLLIKTYIKTRNYNDDSIPMVREPNRKLAQLNCFPCVKTDKVFAHLNIDSTFIRFIMEID